MINGKSTYSSYLLRICHADGNGRLHIYLHPIQKSEKALHFAEIEPFFHYLQTALITRLPQHRYQSKEAVDDEITNAPDKHL